MEVERFVTVNESDLDVIIKEKDAKNTQKATIFAWNILCSYCKAKNIHIDEITTSKPNLDKFLRK
jgi:hypothetical protein